MSRRPQISLIISYYQQQGWLELVLSSALGQRIDVGFEIIVCDDGSSDAGFDVLRRLSVPHDIELLYLWQRDRGFRLSRSRNNGIRCARGVILVFVDGDTWLAPTFLNDHWQAQQASPALVCGMRHTVAASAGELADLDRPGLESLPKGTEPDHLNQRRWLASDRPWMACLGGNFSVPLSNEVYFDERFESWGSEDRDLAFRLIRGGLQPRLLDQPNVIHLQQPGRSVLDHFDHDDVVAFIRNKLLLHRKYPAGELAASVDLIRRCHLDPETQRWSAGPTRHDLSVEDVFSEFRAWTIQCSGGAGVAETAPGAAAADAGFDAPTSHLTDGPSAILGRA